MKKKYSIPLISSYQRKGVLLLFVLIGILQVAIWGISFISTERFEFDSKQTIEMQKQWDSLQNVQAEKKQKIYPFNPNYIQDYKGYQLGMSVEEIDRLHRYRAQGNFVNSAKEFQQVTEISDSLLQKLQPYFKFPDWVENKTKEIVVYNKTENAIVVKDINKATQADLMKINGIGEVLAQRILSERDKYNGFVSIEQVKFVYGINTEVANKIAKYFAVKQMPKIEKININQCQKTQLLQVPYITPSLATQILIYRSKKEEKLTINDLKEINRFPVEKLKIITLYLAF